MYDELYPDAVNADAADKLAQPISLQPADQGVFHNFWKGAGMYTMRGLAETGRAIDMAGAAWPVAMDAAVGGTKHQDEYFKTHDELFNNAVDYWTPKPGEVGAASQVAGGIVSSVAQLLINPAVMIGTAQLSTAEDLNRHGVNATTSNVVGGLAGVSTAVGIKLPYLGKTLAQKVATGVAGNVAQGIVTRGAQGLTLRAAGYGEQAQQFDAWDLKTIALDAAMGAVFGALDYRNTRVTQAEKDALLTMNQARHLETETAPGMPVDGADLTKHTAAVQQALEQVLKGEPVNVDATVQGMRIAADDVMQAQRAAVGDEIKMAVDAEAPVSKTIDIARPSIDTAPIETKLADATTPTDKITTTPADPLIAESQRAITENPDLLIPTGDVNPDGSIKMLKASDEIARIDAETADIQARAPGLFQTVAHCLLGVL